VKREFCEKFVKAGFANRLIKEKINEVLNNVCKSDLI
jgi:hypothetical protein